MELSLSVPGTGIGLSGTAAIAVAVSPAPTRVEFYVGASTNSPAASISTSPYTWNMDTTRYPDGSYVIRAEAVYSTRRSKAQVAISINNSAAKPTTHTGDIVIAGGVITDATRTSGVEGE